MRRIVSGALTGELGELEILNRSLGYGPALLTASGSPAYRQRKDSLELK